MKKIFTLVLTLGILSSAFSQSFPTKVVYATPVLSIGFSTHRWVDMYSFTRNERDFQLDKINTEYNQQVRAIMNMRLSVSRKIDLIQELQRERAFKVQKVNDRFMDYRNKYNYNHYDRNFNWIR